MKKFRPTCAGFITLYVLSAFALVDAVYTLVGQYRGTLNEAMSSFSFFSYLIVVVAYFYVKMYGSSKVEITADTMHIVNPVYIKPAIGEKRANFLFRQGELDIKLLNKTFSLGDMEKFGFIEDLGYAVLDRSGASQDNCFLPIHEVAFVMKDGKRYHWNAGFYSWKQLKQIVTEIQNASGITATGSLADAPNYTKESVKQMKAARKAAKKAGKRKGKKK